MNPDYKQPSFFKIILDGLTNEHLRIPPKFVKHISKEVSETVILRGPSGEPCLAKLCKNTTGLYIEDGWKQFMSDHSLGDNEFLTFTYDGKMSFHVQIFDKSGCERIHVRVRNSNLESASCSKGKLKQGILNKNPVGSLHPHHPNEDEHNISGTSKSFQIRQHSSEGERQKNVETSESFTSEFPHFKVCLGRSSFKKNLQRIPPKFVKHISKEVSETIILKGPSGEPCLAKLCKNTTGLYIEDGWKQFMSDHSLGDNEFLTFIYDGKMSFHVQIFDKSGCERIPVPVRNSNLESASCSKEKLKQGILNKNPVGSLHPHHPNEDEHNISGTSKSFQIRQLSTEGERQKNVERAESFTSEFPHFKVCLGRSSLKKILQHFPARFSRENLLPPTIIIHNSQGRAWEVKRVFNNGRYKFSEGCSSFIIDNEFNMGDVCIFELFRSRRTL